MAAQIRLVGRIKWCPRPFLPAAVARARESMAVLPIRVASTDSTEHPLERSRRLGRPLSPFISIYRFPIPSMVSFSHRVTGGVLSFALWTATIGYVESGMSFQELLTFLESAHPYVLIFGKFAVAWPFCFHGINGIRHLFWDVGYGLNSMKNVYLSGYTVLLLSLLAAMGLAYYKH